MLLSLFSHFLFVLAFTLLPLNGLYVLMCRKETIHSVTHSRCKCLYVCSTVHLVGGLVFIIFALSAFVIEPDDHD